MTNSEFADPRDGKVYKTVKIGNHEWFAENFSLACEDSRCYDDKPANEAKYGRLYCQRTAMEFQPSGWHLPSDEEWDEMLRAADGSGEKKTPYESKTLLPALKACGFGIVFGGMANLNGKFQLKDSYGAWLSSTASKVKINEEEPAVDCARNRFVNLGYDYVLMGGYEKECMFSVRYIRNYDFHGIQDNDDLFSVRCIKDNKEAL